MNDAINIHVPKEAAQSEIASGGAAATADTSESGESDDASGKSAAPLDPAAAAERAKQRKMTAFMAFNFSFMATMFYLMMFKAPPSGFIASLAFALPIGAVIGGTVFALFPSGKK